MKVKPKNPDYFERIGIRLAVDQTFKSLINSHLAELLNPNQSR